MSRTSYDVHQHLWPEGLVSALSRRRHPPRLRKNRLEVGEGSFPFDPREHDLDARLALLDRDGVDAALVSLQPTLGADAVPELVEAYHDGIAELVAASRGRFLALATGSVREGFVGTTVAGRALADGLDGLAPLLDELDASGRILFVHPGPTPPAGRLPGWWNAVVAYTAEMQAAYLTWLANGLERHPGLRVVFAILAGGAPIQLERLSSRGVRTRTALSPNVFLDTASYGRRALELSLATYGVRQLVYGSDSPAIDSRPTLRALADFGDAVADAVRKENPSLLLE